MNNAVNHLQELIKLIFTQDILDGENKYYCDVNVNTTPDYLSIRINRFLIQQMDNDGDINIITQKLYDKVETPAQLSLFKHFNAGQGTYDKYDCIGLVCHGGHYIACIKDETGWWMCNDTTVSPTDFNKAINMKNYDIYICLYRKE